MELSIKAEKPDDHDRMADCRYSQYELANGYHHALQGCERIPLRNLYLDLLDEEHRIAGQITQEMKKRGWIKHSFATQEEIAALRDHYLSAGI